jgi:hypothetical protein
MADHLAITLHGAGSEVEVGGRAGLVEAFCSRCDSRASIMTCCMRECRTEAERTGREIGARRARVRPPAVFNVGPSAGRRRGAARAARATGVKRALRLLAAHAALSRHAQVSAELLDRLDTFITRRLLDQTFTDAVTDADHHGRSGSPRTSRIRVAAAARKTSNRLA